MKISAHEEYGIRCLAQLARHKAKLTIGDIAESEGLTMENAAKVMARLRQLDLVQSLRGKEGGYVLSRPPQEISVGEVIRGMSGGIFELERCQGHGDSLPCVHQTDCGLKPVWAALSNLVSSYLDSITLADLVDEGGVDLALKLQGLSKTLAGTSSSRASRNA